jgi:putative ABC transport system permease protein
VNTLALSVFERTREIGLLRAIGMSRMQTGVMILYEGLIVSIFGALLGLLIGVVFGAALVQALSGDGISLSIPPAQLVLFLVLAGVAGIAAAFFPAWRAARLDVLEAINTE